MSLLKTLLTEYNQVNKEKITQEKFAELIFKELKYEHRKSMMSKWCNDNFFGVKHLYITRICKTLKVKRKVVVDYMVGINPKLEILVQNVDYSKKFK